jgi:phosphate transport system substrate-binding protein
MISAIALATLTLALASCTTAPPNKEPSPGKILLRGAGASFPNPLYQKWSRAYSAHHGDVEVEYKSVGSGKGIEWYLDGRVDFGASDRALSDEQIGEAKRGALLVPTAAGMVVLAYHGEDLPANLRLSRDVYADIFLGKITKWNDPRIAADNPEFKFPKKQIAVIVRQDKSGTTFAFTNHLAAIHPEWKDGPGIGQTVQWRCAPLTAQGNEGVVALIQRTPYALGYAEYGQAKRLGLRMAQLENRAKKFIRPGAGAAVESLATTNVPGNFRVFMTDPIGEHSYPIITYTWILAHQRYADPKKADAVKQFLEWCLTEGQQDCEELGYVRLPAGLAQRVAEAVRKIH